MCITYYRQVSNIRRTKSQHLKDSRTVLRLSLPNPLKADVKSRMKMWSEQGRQAMLQLHPSDRQIVLPTKVRLVLEILRYVFTTSHINLHLWKMPYSFSFNWIMQEFKQSASSFIHFYWLRKRSYLSGNKNTTHIYVPCIMQTQLWDAHLHRTW